MIRPKIGGFCYKISNISRHIRVSTYLVKIIGGYFCRESKIGGFKVKDIECFASLRVSTDLVRNYRKNFVLLRTGRP